MTETELLLTTKIAQVSVPSRLGVKNTLGPITALMADLGHPELKFPSVHVGGTSGKGSTATFIANILGAAGYRVGLFTKPHLSSVCERFTIDGQPISRAELLALVERVGRYATEKPTWFELMTALAFQYFQEQRVDLGVIEVGLGGTYDATNVLLPKLSVLTNVGLDHTEILGNTVEKIATDKAGIIKPNQSVVSGVTQPSVIEIVARRSQSVGARLNLLGRDFACENAAISARGGHFDFSMAGEKYNELKLSVLGQHQVLNATLALAAALKLGEAGYPITEAALRSGLEQTRIAGRMEIAGSRPTLLLDGAHSPPKMAALAEALRSLFPGRKITGVLAFSQGHDAAATLALLAPLLNTAILTSFNATTDYGSRHAQSAAEWIALLAERFPAVERHVELDPLRAVELARKLTAPEDLICVTGSIFLVGQVRPALVEYGGQGHTRYLKR